MGRHGGGSRSGGSSRSSSRSSGGSRSGGSSGPRNSTKPFIGCYNRSYYDRHGRYHSYYTEDYNFGVENNKSNIIVALVLITIQMFIMLGGVLSTSLVLGHKVNGDVARIKVVDNIDLLTDNEESVVLDTLYTVYEKSGMPVTLYTDDYDWKTYYESIEVYSEELYYTMGLDEDSMIILFTSETIDDFFDWEYDMYCGDNTIHCLSDNSFDKLLDLFHKSMAKGDLCTAIVYSWNNVKDDLAKTSINPSMLVALLMFIAFYSIFYVGLFKSFKQQKDAYMYFKDNPENITYSPMYVLDKCPSCGASNSEQLNNCQYCGTLLKLNKN